MKINTRNVHYFNWNKWTMYTMLMLHNEQNLEIFFPWNEGYPFSETLLNYKIKIKTRKVHSFNWNEWTMLHNTNATQWAKLGDFVPWNEGCLFS